MTRDALLAKIAALRAKTTAAGCTEAEAMAAAEAVARLMQQHQMDEAEILMSEAKVRDTVPLSPWRRKLSATISHCTSTAILIDQRSTDGPTVLFLGLTPGPEIAAYLRDIGFRAIDGALVRFQGGLLYASRRGPAAKRHAAEQFCEAMAVRLGERMLEVFGPTIDVAARLEAFGVLERRHTDLVISRPRLRDPSDSAASRAGARAGASIPLHRGVDGDRRSVAGLLGGSRG